MKFYPYEKTGGGGGGGGHKKLRGSFYTVLSMLKGACANSFDSLKGKARKVLPWLEGGGGGAKSFGPAISPFCSPLPPPPPPAPRN